MHSTGNHRESLQQQRHSRSSASVWQQQPKQYQTAYCIQPATSWPVQQQQQQQRAKQHSCKAQPPPQLVTHKLQCRRPQHPSISSWNSRYCRTSAAAAAAAAAGDSSIPDLPIGRPQDNSGGSSSSTAAKNIPIRIAASTDEETYSLKDTQSLVETAMLSAVSGLVFLLSTLLKLDNSLGYLLPLPIAIAACRSGVGVAWHTMMATAFLVLVLLGPLRAVTYVLIHGMLAAALGSMWVWQWPWTASILAGAVLRMAGQMGYLVLSSFTMNENLFAVMLFNVHNLLDRLAAALGSSGSPSTLQINCMIFALLLVNGICYVFMLHVIYHVILSSMGFKLGQLPGIVKKYLYAGVPKKQQQQQQ